jgi:hypothetical protein
LPFWGATVSRLTINLAKSILGSREALKTY